MVDYGEFASGTCVKESLHLPLKVFVDGANYGLQSRMFPVVQTSQYAQPRLSRTWWKLAVNNILGRSYC